MCPSLNLHCHLSLSIHLDLQIPPKYTFECSPFDLLSSLGMDTSPLGLLRLSLPKVPLLLKSALYHTLWLSPTSTKVNLKVELIVAFIRSLLDSPTPNPISKQQAWSLKDPGIKGRLWVSKVTFPVPSGDRGEGVLALLTRAIDDLKTRPDQNYTVPTVLPVEAEWTGYRPNVHKDRERPCLSEHQHYENLMKETKSDVTILYFHGGVHYMMDPATHRQTCARLAQLTGGRCLNVRYRLAPQNPFPAALLDGLVYYLTLLYPPEGSYHKPVVASKIIFAGDSAGGNLAIALLQLLLQINRTASSELPATPKNTIDFHGQPISLPLPLPGGIGCTSPWLDTSRCLPSISHNAKYDYLPPPLTAHRVATFPSCDLWPTDPPRGDIYSELSMLTHPLVSPLAASSWQGSPPVWLGLGEEMLADEIKHVASKLARQGTIVRLEQYEGQCHCFGQIFESLGVVPARRMIWNWATFCQLAAKGAVKESRGVWVKGKGCEEEVEVDIKELSPFSDEDVRYAMRKAQKKREVGEEGEAKILPRL